MLRLGWPEWLLIVGLVGGLLITFKVMAKASVAYARAREMREAKARSEGLGDQNPSEPVNKDREG